MTGLKISFHYKLLIFWLGSVVAALSLVGMVYIYLQNTYLEDFSLKRIENSFSILSAEIEERKKLLLTKTKSFAENDDHKNIIGMIDTYQDIENYLPQVFDLEKKRLAKNLASHAMDIGFDHLSIHDSKTILASFFIKGRDANVQKGFLSFLGGMPVFILIDNEKKIALSKEDILDIREQTNISHRHNSFSIDFHAIRRGIKMETLTPVVKVAPNGSSNTVGEVHATFLLDERLVKEISIKTKTEAVLLLPNGTSFGGLKTDLLAPDDLIKAPPLSLRVDDGQNFHRVSSDGFEFGVTRIALSDGQQAYFIFGSNKAELAQGFTSLEWAILAVFVFTILVVAPAGAYYLNRTFTSPIKRLMSGVEGLREGGHEHLADFDGSDELSTLAQSINSMSDSIHEREMKLRESEERFRALADNTPNKLHIKDAKGRYILINRKSEELFGITNEEVKGRTARDIFPNEISEVFDAHDHIVLEKGESVEAEEEFHLADGVHTFLTVKFPIRDSDGNIIAVGASGFDITKRKRAEAQLIQSNKLATLGEVTTGIAHELNQPLNIIHMVAESLLDEVEDGDVPSNTLTAKLKRIENQVDRASAIIKHMRTFGRAEPGELEEVDLNEVVRGTVGLVSQQLRLSDIDLIVDLPETCRKVLGQQLQLEQVVLNLLTNARDAIMTNKDTGQEVKKISVGIVDDPESEDVILTVTDTGGGIAENVIDHIFEPFFTTKEVGHGTGLGLSISYGIITEMGGHIGANNENGGANFTIVMPTTNETSRQDDA